MVAALPVLVGQAEAGSDSRTLIIVVILAALVALLIGGVLLRVRRVAARRNTNQDPQTWSQGRTLEDISGPSPEPLHPTGPVPTAAGSYAGSAVTAGQPVQPQLPLGNPARPAKPAQPAGAQLTSPTPAEATGGPVWDPKRGRYVQWDAIAQHWFVYDHDASTWIAEV